MPLVVAKTYTAVLCGQRGTTGIILPTDEVRGRDLPWGKRGSHGTGVTAAV
jgi:hypothetical protein